MVREVDKCLVVEIKASKKPPFKKGGKRMEQGSRDGKRWDNGGVEGETNIVRPNLAAEDGVHLDTHCRGLPGW